MGGGGEGGGAGGGGLRGAGVVDRQNWVPPAHRQRLQEVTQKPYGVLTSPACTWAEQHWPVFTCSEACEQSFQYRTHSNPWSYVVQQSYIQLLFRRNLLSVIVV